jgi:LmbE family N-acetylglucosaminyl deacetylase
MTTKVSLIKNMPTPKRARRCSVGRVFTLATCLRLDDLAHVEVNAVIEEVCDEVEPDVVYTHSRREVNRDHVAVHNSTLVATRPGSGVEEVLAYETPSSTEYAPETSGFEPTLFVDITDHIDAKIEAFECYDLETREYPHPRSGKALRALARTRGTASDCAASEAFDVLRMYA